MDEEQNAGYERQSAAGDGHPETPVEVNIVGGGPVYLQNGYIWLRRVCIPRTAAEHSHGRRL